MAHGLSTQIELEDLEGDPHAVLARLRAAEPVAWIPALDGWLVTGYELARAVMRDPDTFTVDDPRFSTSQVIGPSMLGLDGAAHTRHRLPFVAPFRAAAVRGRFEHAIALEVDALIDAFAADASVELRRAFAGPLVAAIVTRALGLHRSEVEAVLGWYDAIVEAVTDITAGRTRSPAGDEAFGLLRAKLEDVIESAGGSSLLAAAAAQSPLSQDELISNAAVLLFGGIETTEGMIANAVLALLEHSEDLALVRSNPGLLDAVLEESLRLEPAAAMVDRYATTDLELAGAEIAEGDLVRGSKPGPRWPGCWDGFRGSSSIPLTLPRSGAWSSANHPSSTSAGADLKEEAHGLDRAARP